MSLNRRDCIASALLLLAGCGAPKPRDLTPQEMPPPAPREFRGAWVATVANIDWPSAPGLPAAQQQAEILRIVERAAKPWLRVGVSPFGLPRTARRPPGIEGFDPYAKLYADAERWLAEGWIDYAAPQLYWPLASPDQAFAVWRRQRGSWRLSSHPAAEPLRVALDEIPLAALVISSVSRTGVESERVSLRLMDHD